MPTWDMTTEKQQLLAEIEAHADPRYERVVRKSVPSRLTVYGLRVFEIKRLVKAWRQEHKGVALEDLLVLVETLWKGPSREERLVALGLLQHYPQTIPQLSRTQFDRWRQDLDSWELTDVLGREVLGAWVAEDQEGRAEYLWALIEDRDVWSRRLGLIGGIGLIRVQKEEGSLDLLLDLVDHLKHDHEPPITKAVSWALRELGKRYPERVSAYLEANEASLARHVIREVRNKLETGRKNGRRTT